MSDDPAAPATSPGAYCFHHDIDVRFHDLDAMGHAHHSLPLICFEEARAAYWREVMGRAGVEGIDYVIAEARVHYLQRIGYPARLRVGVRVTAIGAKSFTTEYAIWSADGRTLAVGTTVQVMYDYEAGRSRPVPAEVRARMEAWERITTRAR